MLWQPQEINTVCELYGTKADTHGALEEESKISKIYERQEGLMSKEIGKFRGKSGKKWFDCKNTNIWVGSLNQDRT